MLTLTLNTKLFKGVRSLREKRRIYFCRIKLSLKSNIKKKSSFTLCNVDPSNGFVKDVPNRRHRKFDCTASTIRTCSYFLLHLTRTITTQDEGEKSVQERRKAAVVFAGWRNTFVFFFLFYDNTEIKRDELISIKMCKEIEARTYYGKAPCANESADAGLSTKGINRWIGKKQNIIIKHSVKPCGMIFHSMVMGAG